MQTANRKIILAGRWIMMESIGGWSFGSADHPRSVSQGARSLKWEMSAKVPVLLLVLAVALFITACSQGPSPTPVPAEPALTVAPTAPATPAAPTTPTVPALSGLLAVTTPSGTGELELKVTDAPPEGVSAIVVTLSNIEVHKEAAGEEEGWIAWFVATSTSGTTSTVSKTFDLLEVTGIEMTLGIEKFPLGRYDQIRMDVAEVLVTFQPSEGGTTTKAAEVPGDKLKVVRAFTVRESQRIITTLDFDAGESVVITGDGDVRFTPVFTVRQKIVDSYGGGGSRACGGCYDQAPTSTTP